MAIPLEAMDDSPSNNPMGYKSSAEMRKMSDADLATYIDQCTSDYDGVAQSVRVALVRLLRPGPVEGAGLTPASDRKDQSLVEEGGSTPPLAATVKSRTDREGGWNAERGIIPDAVSSPPESQ